MPFSEYLSHALLDHVLREPEASTEFPQPTGLWLSLHGGDPGTGGANEISGGSYARQPITFGAPSNKVSPSSNSQVFEGLPGGLINHAGIWDSATGGNFLYGDALGTPRNTNPDDSISFAPGAIGVRHQ